MRSKTFAKAVAASLVMLLIAMALRYGVIEPREIGAACQAGLGPWWCGVRMAVVMVFQSGVLGGGSLIAAAAEVVIGDKAWGRAAAVAAMMTGAAGLVLYNAGLGGAGFLLGLITLARALTSTPPADPVTPAPAPFRPRP